jgi:hypothetical protein
LGFGSLALAIFVGYILCCGDFLIKLDDVLVSLFFRSCLLTSTNDYFFGVLAHMLLLHNILRCLLIFRYILIYPQGCDVCNHLSLFLCVANHDKLLPGWFNVLCVIFDTLHDSFIMIFKWFAFISGWSHFAQFTIAVINRDPKKSKYSGEFVELSALASA